MPLQKHLESCGRGHVQPWLRQTLSYRLYSRGRLNGTHVLICCGPVYLAIHYSCLVVSILMTCQPVRDTYRWIGWEIRIHWSSIVRVLSVLLQPELITVFCVPFFLSYGLLGSPKGLYLDQFLSMSPWAFQWFSSHRECIPVMHSLPSLMIGWGYS